MTYFLSLVFLLVTLGLTFTIGRVYQDTIAKEKQRRSVVCYNCGSDEVVDWSTYRMCKVCNYIMDKNSFKK